MSASQFEEKQIEREEIYDGAVLHVVKDKILLPDGNTSYREFCLHKGAVAVIPITDDNEAVMVRQFRYAHHREFLEIPAGKFDFIGEDPLEAAKRELVEETGAVAENTPTSAYSILPLRSSTKRFTCSWQRGLPSVKCTPTRTNFSVWKEYRSRCLSIW